MRAKHLKYLPIWVSVIVLAVGFYAAKRLQPGEDQQVHSGLDTAVFGGGCFWGIERAFEQVEGTIDVVSGYSGGEGEDPTYEDYARKGHTEVVRVAFDPRVVSYRDLLAVFWEEVGAACQLRPKGTKYRTVIFWLSEEQRKQAEESRQALQKSGRYPEPIATEIRQATRFYRAEEYHQDFHRKSGR